MTKVLFVCMGNICRSPAAEGIFQQLLNQHNLSDQITCDSAGTTGYHAGGPADARMRRHASNRGYELTSIARQVDAYSDFETFDWIIGMDGANIDNLMAMAPSPEHQQKIHLMTDYCTQVDASHVPDPYYGGDAGFENVLDILEDACVGVLAEIRNNA